MKRWLPRFAIVSAGTYGWGGAFFYGKALIIQWGDFVIELTFARSDEVTK